MKNVLFIYYYFPPRGGVAVQRIVKLCKYLVQQNCNVHVLTSGAEYTSFRDDSLLDEVPPSIKIYTTGEENSLEGQFGRKNIFIDAFLTWTPVALRNALNILKKNQIDVIITTSPPHSQQLIGFFLKWLKGILKDRMIKGVVSQEKSAFPVISLKAIIPGNGWMEHCAPLRQVG